MCEISVLHHNIRGEVTQSMNNFETGSKVWCRHVEFAGKVIWTCPRAHCSQHPIALNRLKGQTFACSQENLCHTVGEGPKFGLHVNHPGMKKLWLTTYLDTTSLS